VRHEIGRSLPLLVLFAVGLGAGVWIFVSPWALAYPAGSHGWSSSIWASVWVGGIVVGASAASLVAVLARAVHLALLPRADGE
jgi:hypothetical protein